MSTIGFKYKPSEKARSIGGGQEVCACLSSETHDAAVAFCYDGYNQRGHEEVSMTLRSAMTGTEGNDADPKVAYGIDPVERVCGGETPFVELSRTIDAGHGRAGSGVLQTVGFKAGQSKDGGLGDEREVSPTLSHQPSALEPTVAQSQCDLAAMRYIVRRLTPTECERLMGLPDGYTVPAGLDANDPALVAEFQRTFDTFNAIMADYAHKKPPKPKSAKQVADWLKKIANPATCPDSPRYTGCGNGWATNQPRWILTRLLNAEDIEW